MKDNRIKKVVSNGKEYYYRGNGLWFGRTSKVKAMEGLLSGALTPWSLKVNGEENTSVTIDDQGDIVLKSDVVEVAATEPVSVDEVAENQDGCEVVDAEIGEIIGRKFDSIEQLEDCLNTVNESGKVWVVVTLPNREKYRFQCYVSKHQSINLKAYCMQSLKGSLAFGGEEIYQKLLDCCQLAWGHCEAKDCYESAVYLPYKSGKKYSNTKYEKSDKGRARKRKWAQSMTAEQREKQRIAKRDYMRRKRIENKQ